MNVSFPCTIEIIEHRIMTDNHVWHKPHMMVEVHDLEQLNYMKQHCENLKTIVSISWLTGEKSIRKYVMKINGQIWKGERE